MGQLVVADGGVGERVLVDWVLGEVSLHIVLGGEALCLPEALSLAECALVFAIQHKVQHTLIHSKTSPELIDQRQRVVESLRGSLTFSFAASLLNQVHDLC